MKIFGCQFDVAWENKNANLDKAESLLAQASLPPGALIVLPEMCLSGFSMNLGGIAEPAGNESERRLAGLALRHGVYLQAGLVCLGPDGRSRNQSVTFSPEGTEIARYSKLHPFTLGGESATYAAGTQVHTFQCGHWLVAPFICYDLRFPEIFRMAAWKRPHLFTVIASWPEVRIGHWMKLLQARAIENQAYVIGINRIGRDPKLNHPGRSLIVNYHGEILADAEGREGVIHADLDLAMLEEYRRALPFLDDLRAEEVRR